MAILLVVLFVLLCWFFTWAMCRAAGRADNFSDEVYKNLQKKEAPQPPDNVVPHPSVRRAMGR